MENNGWFLIKKQKDFLKIDSEPIGKDFLIYNQDSICNPDRIISHVCLIDFNSVDPVIHLLKYNPSFDNVEYMINLSSKDYWFYPIKYPFSNG